MKIRRSGGHANKVGRVTAALVALGLLAACGSGGGSAAKSGPGGTPSGGSRSGGQASACQGSDPAASIRAASAAQSSASSYQLDTTSATKLGNSHLTLQVQQPDRFHFTAVAPNGQTTELLAIGSSQWTKSNGSWTTSPGLNLASLMKQAEPLGESLLNGTTFSDASVDLHATLHGQPAVLDKFHMSTPAAQLNADLQLWLASETCQPLQAISSFTEVVNGVTSTGRSTMNWSGWNAVRIEAPA